jgi:hypothetical protein
MSATTELGYQFTIDSDEEVAHEGDTDDEDDGGLALEEWEGGDYILPQSRASRSDEPKQATTEDDSDGDYEGEGDVEDDYVKDMPRTDERAERAGRKLLQAKKKQQEAGDNEGEDEEELAAQFFDSVEDSSAEAGKDVIFAELNLSRALLRAVSTLHRLNTKF